MSRAPWQLSVLSQLSASATELWLGVLSIWDSKECTNTQCHGDIRSHELEDQMLILPLFLQVNTCPDD